MSTHKREIQGVVVKKSGDKTASILVTRSVLHPKYHKTVKRFNKYFHELPMKRQKNHFLLSNQNHLYLYNSLIH